MSHAAAASRLANPFAGDVPNKVEHRLSIEDVEFTTISYNERGTYLAAGSKTGELVIWDLITLTPALRVQHLHDDEITSVSWVKKGKGRLICTTSQDGFVKIYDLERRAIVRKLQFRDEIIGAGIHPENMEETLVCLGANTEKEYEVPWPGMYRLDMKDTSAPLIRYIPRDWTSPQKCYGVAAAFSKHGRMVFVGGVAGAIYTFATSTGEQLKVFHPESIRGMPKGWIIALSLSRNGRVLLSDGGGKTIAVYDVASDLLLGSHDVLPSDASLDAIQDAMRWRAGKMLTFRRHLQDVVGSTKWNDVGCSGDAEFVMAVSAVRDAHEIFVWDRTGHLVDQLKDTTSAFGQVSRGLWHPWRPQIATVTGLGQICLWGNTKSNEDKSWLAFAPGFVEIEENVVYNEDEENGSGVTSASREEEEAMMFEPVDVVGSDAFPTIFSEDEDSDEETPSLRTAPRCISRGIGYFIQSTSDEVVVEAMDAECRPGI